MNRALIRGLSDVEIRKLVVKLERRRVAVER